MASNSYDGFAMNLRETLLQDSMNLAEESLVVEVAAQIVIELIHGTPSPSKISGFLALSALYHLPQCWRYMQSLGRCGGPMHNLARRVFEPL